MDRLQKNNKQPLEIQRRFTLIGLILALSVAAMLSTRCIGAGREGG